MNVTAGSRPVGVPDTTVAAFTAPEKGAVAVGAVEKLKPQCTARLPSLCAWFPGTRRVSAVAPATAL